MLFICIWASKRAGSTANFIVAGRRLPIWIGSATIVATWFGGGTMMGAAGASYDRGLLGVIADPFVWIYCSCSSNGAAPLSYGFIVRPASDGWNSPRWHQDELVYVPGNDGQRRDTEEYVRCFFYIYP